ncbi:ATP-binding protein [Streptacidiphilus monticola]
MRQRSAHPPRPPAPAPGAALLGATEDLVEDGVLMATEAVANATLHADGPYLLRLRHSSFEALIEVHDRTLYRPRLAPAETHLPHQKDDPDTHGRGLLIIHRLSQGCWGFRTYPGHKVCWFAIPLEGSRADNPSG